MRCIQLLRYDFCTFTTGWSRLSLNQYGFFGRVLKWFALLSLLSPLPLAVWEVYSCLGGQVGLPFPNLGGTILFSVLHERGQFHPLKSLAPWISIQLPEGGCPSVEKGKVWWILISPSSVYHPRLNHASRVGMSKCTEDEFSPVVLPAQPRWKKLLCIFFVYEFF